MAQVTQLHINAVMGPTQSFSAKTPAAATPAMLHYLKNIAEGFTLLILWMFI